MPKSGYCVKIALMVDSKSISPVATGLFKLIIQALGPRP